MNEKRVFWILIGGKNSGSARIHGYNIHDAFLKNGINSTILHQSGRELSFKKQLKIIFSLKKNDLLILQKRKEPSIKRMLFLLKIKKVKIAFVDCDLPVCDKRLVRYIDYIICASNALSKLYKKKYPQKKIKYIADAVEYFTENFSEYNHKAIYFGWLTEERLEIIEALKKIFTAFGWEIITMSNRNNPDIQWEDWSSEKTFQIIGEHTVSLIPIDSNELSQYKSANRVLQSLALGNIVLCGNIESYREVIINNYNGFICSKPSDWENALIEISDEYKRNKIIENGFETAQNFKMDNIILKWRDFLQI